MVAQPLPTAVEVHPCSRIADCLDFSLGLPCRCVERHPGQDVQGSEHGPEILFLILPAQVHFPQDALASVPEHRFGILGEGQRTEISGGSFENRPCLRKVLTDQSRNPALEYSRFL